MAIKSDVWIEQWAPKLVEPYNPEHINPASYDVSLSDSWICPTREPQEFTAEEVTLYPGEVILGCTLEYVDIPRTVTADLKLKSSLGRLFLNHSMSGWIDPGFSGQITLEFQNIGPEPRVLKKGMRVAQLVFMELDQTPKVSYDRKGNYNGQTGATPSWSDKFFPTKK